MQTAGTKVFGYLSFFFFNQSSFTRESGFAAQTAPLYYGDKIHLRTKLLADGLRSYISILTVTPSNLFFSHLAIWRKAAKDFLKKIEEYFTHTQKELQFLAQKKTLCVQKLIKWNLCSAKRQSST